MSAYCYDPWQAPRGRVAHVTNRQRDSPVRQQRCQQLGLSTVLATAAAVLRAVSEESWRETVL